MRKRRVHALAACLVTLAAGGLAAITPGAASASAITAHPKAISQDIWSGYSTYPVRGTIWDSEATWNVPAVTCPLNTDTPRAAVWVGMWGGTTSIKKHTTWLPQIGTDSQCDEYGRVSYFALWEMFTNIRGQGTPPEKIKGLTVDAGDEIQAAVAYIRADRAGKREFELRITDVTRESAGHPHYTWLADKWTSRPTPLADAARQGGAIVENEPPCHKWPDCFSSGGLAHFSLPVSVTDDYVLGGSGGYRHFDWKMVRNGRLLAKNSALHGTSYPSEWKGAYTVTWHHNNRRSVIFLIIR